MIKRFDKNAGQFYMNELELIVAFILNEFLNYVAIFNAYNVEHDIIDFRRVIYVVLATFLAFFVISLVSITCIAVLMHLMGLI